MLQKFVTCWPLFWIFDQAPFHEVSKIFWPTGNLASYWVDMLLRKLGWFIFSKCEECLPWWQIGVKGLSLRHFYRRNTDRPYITLVVVSVLDYLWSHPARCTHDTLTPAHTVWQLCTNSKISQLYFSICSQKYICAFYISVNFVERVEKFDTKKDFSEDYSDIDLAAQAVTTPVSNDFFNWASTNVLHHYEKLVALDERFEEFRYVRICLAF